jgi:hypothetical protein
MQADAHACEQGTDLHFAPIKSAHERQTDSRNDKAGSGGAGSASCDKPIHAAPDSTAAQDQQQKTYHASGGSLLHEQATIEHQRAAGVVSAYIEQVSM